MQVSAGSSPATCLSPKVRISTASTVGRHIGLLESPAFPREEEDVPSGVEI